MKEFIKKLFIKKNTKLYDNFYDFCINYPEEKKKGLFIKAIKEANKEQRDLIDRYDRTIKPLRKD